MFASTARRVAVAALLAVPAASASSEEQGRRLFGSVVKFDEFPVPASELPKEFCGELDLTGIKIKLNVKLTSDGSTDITGNLDGDWMLQCKDQKFDFEHEGGIFKMIASADPETGDKRNCLSTQFENMQQDPKDLIVSFKKTATDEGINLFSPSMGNVLLKHQDNCADLVTIKKEDRRLDAREQRQSEPVVVV
eukprot:TRINITY_DN102372_c0_g1_i1.p2 TRINITY_DN102372_c0_g1~~TRINITY_DN102372_c0_g1_i1.p2  ORF type:complete len:193 (-),score=67.29 TRINITY_DN102372_c0_g1_i1:98-676(-)